MKFYHTATREDYDALMIELDGQGYKWFRGQKMQDFDGFEEYEEKTVIRIDDSKNAMLEYYDREKDVLEYKAKGDDMNEKQFKQQSHDLVVNIASAIGTFATSLELSDDDLAKTQKLVKKFDDTLTEFIDSRKPKFEVGDCVVIDASNIIAKIDEISDGVAKNEICYDFDTSRIRKNFTGGLGYTRHATPEEIAEYEAALNFHKHGRKPFEVEDGDLLENKFGKYIAHKSLFVKENFTVEGNAFLKTAEEVNEWVGADDDK